MDSQVVELIGRQYVIAELFRADCEVALPLRDRGVDAIAYRERAGAEFVAVPLQIKASSRRGWGVNSKYEKSSGLLLAYVWNVAGEAPLEIFAMTYPESMAIAEVMGYLKTPSWLTHGAYATTAPSGKLVSLLRDYRMTPATWRARLSNR